MCLVAVLSDRIADLTRHVVANKKDVQTKRSLVIVVQQRRKLMKYLLRKDADRYMTVVKRLGLRPNSVFSKDRPLGAKKAATLDLSEK